MSDVHLTDQAGQRLREAFGNGYVPSRTVTDLENEGQAFSAVRTCEIARISYRQLDYWARTDLVRPSLSEAHGSGTRRLYSRDDVVMLVIIRTLLDLGLALQVVRGVAASLQENPPEPGAFLVCRSKYGREHGCIGGVGIIEDATVTADPELVLELIRTKPCLVMVIPEPPNLSEPDVV